MIRWGSFMPIKCTVTIYAEHLWLIAHRIWPSPQSNLFQYVTEIDCHIIVWESSSETLLASATVRFEFRIVPIMFSEHEHLEWWRSFCCIWPRVWFQFDVQKHLEMSLFCRDAILCLVLPFHLHFLTENETLPGNMRMTRYFWQKSDRLSIR
jgi:hypothetical protein